MDSERAGTTSKFFAPLPDHAPVSDLETEPFFLPHWKSSGTGEFFLNRANLLFAVLNALPRYLGD
jgi:hypothetical protein